MSLARTQSLLTRGANAGVCLRGMLNEEIAAETPSMAAYCLQGEDVLLPPKAAEVLSLAIHELATNALRHGTGRTALAGPALVRTPCRGGGLGAAPAARPGPHPDRAARAV
ncbi:hypothetical protein G6F58_013211 [Rhizopus delemar]|nr:hypothetical protein G6F58_013211 [Rhizopus delemar]